MKIGEINKNRNMKGYPLTTDYIMESKDNPIEFFYNHLGVWKKTNAIISIDELVLERMCEASFDYTMTSMGGKIYLDELGINFIKIKRYYLYSSSYLVVHANLNYIEYKGATFEDELCQVSLSSDLKLRKCR